MHDDRGSRHVIRHRHLHSGIEWATRVDCRRIEILEGRHRVLRDLYTRVRETGERFLGYFLHWRIGGNEDVTRPYALKHVRHPAGGVPD